MESIDQSQLLAHTSGNNDMSNFADRGIPAERDVNNGSATYDKLSEGMTGENTGRSSMKPSGNTHYNIFGDPPVSPRRSGKVYHMSSDIFGVGSIVSRSGQHLNNQSDQKGFHDTDFSNTKAGDANKNNGGRMERKGSTTKMPDDWKPNARENGCNPVTGDGYAEGDAGKTQKRHYQRGRSQSLW